MKFPCNISVCRNAYVHALGAALLLGTLSMLFAEVFSGASRMWFLDVGAWILAFPLYLGHALFFLWIALNTGRIKVEQLYLFGVLFGLYESWITKVLWAGYLDWMCAFSVPWRSAVPLYFALSCASPSYHCCFSILRFVSLVQLFFCLCCTEFLLAGKHV
jgi:hypothetical protein